MISIVSTVYLLLTKRHVYSERFSMFSRWAWFSTAKFGDAKGQRWWLTEVLRTGYSPWLWCFPRHHTRPIALLAGDKRRELSLCPATHAASQTPACPPSAMNTSCDSHKDWLYFSVLLILTNAVENNTNNNSSLVLWILLELRHFSETRQHWESKKSVWHWNSDMWEKSPSAGGF